MAYDIVGEHPVGKPTREECVRAMVESLRARVERDYPQFLPPDQDNPEAALRELLDLLIDAAPDDLLGSAVSRMEAIEEGFPLTDREKAFANFYADEVDLAFVRLAQSATT
jgi:hypothetical protein